MRIFARAPHPPKSAQMRRYRARCGVCLFVVSALLLLVAGLAFSAARTYAGERDAVTAFAAACVGLDSPACNWACVPALVDDGARRVCQWCTSPPQGAQQYCVNASDAMTVTNDGTCALPSRVDGCSDCQYDSHDPRVLIGACAFVASIALSLACMNCCTCCPSCCVCCCCTAGSALTLSAAATFASGWSATKGGACDDCARCCCGCGGAGEPEHDAPAAGQAVPMLAALLSPGPPPFATQ